MKRLALIGVLTFVFTHSAFAGLRVHRIDELGTDSPSSPRFDHKEARAEAERVFVELAKREKWDFTQSSESEIFTDKGLKDIDVIVFDNNSGLLFNDAEKKVFEKWVRNGGGVIGIHGATHAHKGVNEKNEADWPFWYRLWGVLHKTGPKAGPQGRRGYADWVNVRGDEERWNRKFPKNWKLEKVEWYFWNYNENFKDALVIATADVKTNQPDLPEYYPVTWCHEYLGGRVWYTNMGHYAENFHQEEFVQHIVDGIDWVSENGKTISIGDKR